MSWNSRLFREKLWNATQVCKEDQKEEEEEEIEEEKEEEKAEEEEEEEEEKAEEKAEENEEEVMEKVEKEMGEEDEEEDKEVGNIEEDEKKGENQKKKKKRGRRMIWSWNNVPLLKNSNRETWLHCHDFGQCFPARSSHCVFKKLILTEPGVNNCFGINSQVIFVRKKLFHFILFLCLQFVYSHLRGLII